MIFRKLSYSAVAFAVAPIEARMILARVNGDYIREQYEREAYLAVLVNTGWTEDSFNAETLKRIDQSWDIKTPSPRGNHPASKPVALFGVAGLCPWKRTEKPCLS